MLRAGGAAGDLVVRNAGAGALTPIPASLSTVSNADVTNAVVLIDHPMMIESNLVVGGAGDVSHTAAQAGGLVLTVGGDLTIASGGALHADGRGHPSSTGPGEGVDGVAASGGGHGGHGGTTGAFIGGIGYGSVTNPMTFGSGGGRDTNNAINGGAGGGLVKLEIGGTLTVEGRLSSNGANGPGADAGGGAGGSLNITSGGLAGSGAIRANGGTLAGSGAGGGGGRIAITLASNSFAGVVEAATSGTVRRGGAGTVFITDSNTSQTSVRIDNLGVAGALTTIPPEFTGSDVCVIAGRSSVIADHLLTFGECSVTGASTVAHTAGLADGLHINAGAMSISSDSTLTGDARGLSSSSGPGEGGDGVAASGGGYGGRGGFLGTFAGGASYGSVTNPTDLGSGGGRDTNNAADGGRGGGRIRLSIGDTLTVDGAIEADGGSGTGADAGGGSGGSIVIDAGEIAGSGRVTADGGAGTGSGAGGSGGRIALTRSTNSFAGLVSAVGGGASTGTARGGAGTIFSKAPSDSLGDLSIFNSGVGAPTPLPEVFVAGDDGLISGGAILQADHLVSFQTFAMTAGASITHTAQSSSGLRLDVNGDMTIDSGTVVNADGLGDRKSVV